MPAPKQKINFIVVGLILSIKLIPVFRFHSTRLNGGQLLELVTIRTELCHSYIAQSMWKIGKTSSGSI
jgi:hypothetical protein